MYKKQGKLTKVILGVLISACMIGCGNNSAGDGNVNAGTDNALVEKYNATSIALSDSQILVDGKPISTNSANAVYAANDIVFYLEGQDFTYGEGTSEDAHSKKQADAHTVVHITEPGNYVISGTLSKGQIALDLGKDADEDPDAIATLILDNVDITCEVAPAVIFYDVYECASDDEEDATGTVDISGAGANVILADGSVNNVSGSYVAKIYESVELNEAGTKVVDSEKLHKYDAAFYSKSSMNIDGEEEGTGVLNIFAENEGLGTELHLSINGGNINITSGNDGINTNEDGVSVTTINGGNLNIVVDGATGEGDGIDSNGWLVINGGSVTASACGKSADAGIDSDMGIHLNGGFVAATGNMLDEIADSKQNYAVFSFDSSVEGGSTIFVKTQDGEIVGEYTPENNFMYLVISTEKLTEGTYTLWNGEVPLSGAKMENGHGMMGGRGPQMQGGGMPDGERPEMPEGEMPGGERPEMPEGEMPGGERPEMPEGEMPDGERPELPEGEMPQNPGDGRGFGGGNLQEMELAAEFSIANGGNLFMVRNE